MTAGLRPSPREVVSQVVAEVAPEEAAIVHAFDDVGHDEAVRRLKRSRARREPLGFGLGEVVALVTPVIWIVLDEVLNKSAESAVTATGGWLKPRLVAVFRRLTGRDPAPRADPVMPVMTAEQLRAVHDRIKELGAEAGLEAKQAEQVADGVVARLAIQAASGERPELES
ncbi:hypothetical protein Ssi03_21760 [Sphaerisporangium siamense]|uniref:Uncharacterized protein n=1 Tax=Sphaerisporangium siamense TaxID=795645 RepID=A0A7W7GCD9_9ACTN|nr:hypothetical protein [Sphaerisporangium siamense]MBB4701906.1 hypothetical protein [Sphaerisporangium siamense]GII84186.1 hypothetical protein Ssi03_21760 [Sphaerisporangium siamense]